MHGRCQLMSLSWNGRKSLAFRRRFLYDSDLEHYSKSGRATCNIKFYAVWMGNILSFRVKSQRKSISKWMAIFNGLEACKQSCRSSEYEDYNNRLNAAKLKFWLTD